MTFWLKPFLSALLALLITAVLSVGSANARSAGYLPQGKGTTATNPAHDLSNSYVEVGLPTAGDGAGYAYLDTLLSSDRLTVEEMQLLQHHYYDQQVQLGPLGQLLVNYLTSAIIPGSGIVAAMQKVAVSGLLEGVITGKLDVNALLKDIAFAGVSNWATGAIDLNALGIEGLSGDSYLGMGEQFSEANLAEGLLDTAITSGLSSVAYGTDFTETFLNNYASFATMAATADLQTGIGDWAEVNGGEGTAGHILRHAGVGCVASAILTGNCAAGAAGAASAAWLGGFWDQNGTLLSDTEQQQVSNLLGGFSAALASGGDISATMIAADIAQSATANNRQLHRDEIEWLRENAEVFAEKYGLQLNEALRRLMQEAASRVDRLYRTDEADPEAAAFLDENKPQGCIVSTSCSGDYVDQNQLWFATSSAEQFNNPLINTGTLFTDTDLYRNLEAFNASYGGDPNVFLTTQLSAQAVENGYVADLSPAETVALMQNSINSIDTVLASDRYTPTQQVQALAAGNVLHYGVNQQQWDWSLGSLDPDLSLNGLNAGQIADLRDELTSIALTAAIFLAPEEMPGGRIDINDIADVRNNYRTNLDVATNRTGTVWDDVKATADNIPNTEIPATFEFSSNGQSFWVNANGTEHLGELVSGSGNSPWNSGINSQTVLNDFSSAVSQITSNGTPVMNQTYQVGGWEIIFRQNSTDRLPVIIHALPLE